MYHKGPLVFSVKTKCWFISISNTYPNIFSNSGSILWSTSCIVVTVDQIVAGAMENVNDAHKHAGHGINSLAKHNVTVTIYSFCFWNKDCIDCDCYFSKNSWCYCHSYIGIIHGFKAPNSVWGGVYTRNYDHQIVFHGDCASEEILLLPAECRSGSPFSQSNLALI